MAEVMKSNTWVKEVVPTQFQAIRRATYQTMKLDPQALSILQRSARSGTKRREVGRSSVTQQVTTERRHAFLGPQFVSDVGCNPTTDSEGGGLGEVSRRTHLVSRLS